MSHKKMWNNLEREERQEIEMLFFLDLCFVLFFFLALGNTFLRNKKRPFKEEGAE